MTTLCSNRHGKGLRLNVSLSSQMESELERFHKQNTQLELNIGELRQKLRAAETEGAKERQRGRDTEAAVRRFKTDLHNCVGYIQDPKLLKESIKALYQKHVQEDIVSSAHVFFVGSCAYFCKKGRLQCRPYRAYEPSSPCSSNSVWSESE